MHLRLVGGNAHRARSGASVLSDCVSSAGVGALPAEDGRRRRPPAGPALRRVEEVVTSRNHQRIDRPLLGERSPVRMAGVLHLWPGWCRWPSWYLRRSEARTGVRRILDVGTSMETGWSLRAATWTRRLVRRGRRGPEPLLPQVTARLKEDERSPCWHLVAAGGHQKCWEAEGLLLLLPLAGLRHGRRAAQTTHDLRMGGTHARRLAGVEPIR
jgi:hypothetical protein